MFHDLLLLLQPALLVSVYQVVKELLSGNPHLDKESVRSIADGAMMEAASICVGQMVRQVSLL